ncbi:hypothetical protein METBISCDRAFT_22533 [Metschnikowia bicuspidata]|uniref:Uncharacterized protein n=1 Tax=Metschnikowia bicuspidata TaxID=27322 RepID=A0A4P9ZE22_9ASCO|nr:hypothetical protein METBISCDRAFT_22533 [Metschnikowia bicuspidata]
MNATPKLFLIYETTFDKNNIPDALIDLDEILRHTSALLERSQSVHSREQHALPETVEEAGLFCQARSLPQLLPPTYSYLPFSSPAYLKQPLREPTDRAIEEEDDIEETALDYPESSTTQLFSGDYHASANGGRTTARNSGLYEISVNSSNSSLPSIEASSQRSVLAHPLEKSYSNSSRESALSGLGFIRNNSLTHNSGAKATRYQTFCEQSLNISSAIKNMSSENVNLQASSVSNTPTSSYELALLSPNSPHSLTYHGDSLGHSSSMSSLKLPCLAEKRARNFPAGILGNSGTGNTFDSRTREFPKHPYTTTIRMHDANLRGGSPVTAHDFPYRINLKEMICQTVNEKPKRVTSRKSLPVPPSANKCRANDNSLSPLSENTDNVSTESVGDHGSDHSSLASQPEILQQSTKGDVISRNVTHVQDLEDTKCETYVKPLDDCTSPIHVRKTAMTNSTQPKSLPAISVLSPKVLSTHKKVPQESRIPPRKTFDRTRATSENIKKNADSVLNLQVGPNSRIRAKEHKRTGSGHRLLSNWLKKCA